MLESYGNLFWLVILWQGVMSSIGHLRWVFSKKDGLTYSLYLHKCIFPHVSCWSLFQLGSQVQLLEVATGTSRPRYWSYIPQGILQARVFLWTPFWFSATWGLPGPDHRLHRVWRLARVQYGHLLQELEDQPPGTHPAVCWDCHFYHGPVGRVTKVSLSLVNVLYISWGRQQYVIIWKISM